MWTNCSCYIYRSLSFLSHCGSTFSPYKCFESLFQSTVFLIQMSSIVSELSCVYAFPPHYYPSIKYKQFFFLKIDIHAIISILKCLLCLLFWIISVLVKKNIKIKNANHKNANWQWRIAHWWAKGFVSNCCLQKTITKIKENGTSYI